MTRQERSLEVMDRAFARSRAVDRARMIRRNRLTVLTVIALVAMAVCALVG